MDAGSSRGAVWSGALVCFTVVAGACAETGSFPATVVIDTTATGVVVARNTGAGAWLPGESWQPTEVMRIGDADGEETYLFASIRDVRLDGDGRVYVLENQAGEVRVFESSGVHSSTFGGKGEGPGEFRNATGMTWGPDGNLWVVDVGNQRYTVFTRDGELVATHPRAIGGWGFHWDGGFDREARLLEPAFFRAGDGRSRSVYIRHELSAGGIQARDTFDLPSFESPSMRVEWGGGAMVFAVPFAAQLTWSFDGDGGFWVGTGERYRLWHQSLEGDTTRVVELDRELRKVTEEDRALARTRIEGYLRDRPGIEQVDFSLIPDRHPSHGPLVVDDQGWLWVSQRLVSPPGEGTGPNPTTFDVFDPEGRYCGEVEVNVSMMPPPEIRGTKIAGVIYDELGVQKIVVLELRGR